MTIIARTSSENFNVIGQYDVKNQTNNRTIVIHQTILNTAPLSVIQYVIAHEFAHMLQDVFYFEELLKEYSQSKNWHGNTFYNIMDNMGYANMNHNYFTVPKIILQSILGSTSKYIPRMAEDKWKSLGGSLPTIKFI